MSFPRHVVIVLALLALLAVLNLPAKANDVYIAQAASGSANGSSCANPYAYTYFNISGNWTSGTPSGAQIGPGTTVHLCGTFTASAGAGSFLSVQGSGTSGKPITILWEAGAIVQAPYFGADPGGIALGGHGYITLDGGTNGMLRNTANGTGLTYQQASSLIRDDSCGGNITIKNLQLLDAYQHASGDPNGGESYNIYLRGCSNVTVGPGNTITQADVGFLFIYNGGESNLVIQGNTWRDANQNIEVGSSDSSATSLTNVSVYGNTATGWSNWDEPGDGYHHNFFHPFTNTANSSIVGTLLIYNNNIYGSVGQWVTSFIFLENNNGGTGGSMGTWYIFNNVFHKTNVITGGGGDGMVVPCNGGSSGYIVNNTFVDDDSASTFPVMQTYGSGWSVENNVIDGGGYGLYADSTLTTTNNNDYYGIVQGWKYNNIGYTFPLWKSACGCDANSITTSPLLNASYVPQSGSPVIGLGTNLTSLNIAALNSDAAGNARPSSGAWTAGAYSISSSSTGLQPPTGLTAAVQ